MAISLNFIKFSGNNSDKPLLVYLPGMDGSGELFHLQAVKLQANFDIACISIYPEYLYDLDVLAEKTIELIKEQILLNPHKSIYLCGESFGGCLTLKIALLAPDLAQKIILVNPASSFNQIPLLPWGGEIIPWLPEFIHQNGTLFFLPLLAAVHKIEAKNRHALLKAMRRLPQKVVSWRIKLLREFVVDKEQLKIIKQPVLIIASMSDRLLPSVTEAQRLINYLPSGKIHLLPDSGHACLLETQINLQKILHQHDFLS